MRFINPDLRKVYDEKGYLRLPFLNEDQLIKIDAIVSEYIHLNNDVKFVISNYNTAPEICKQMNTEINNVIKPSIDKLIEDYTILFSVVASKNTSSESKVKFHTDRCYIDETKNVPLNLWVPLCDVSKDNGGLGVFEGSHKFTYTYRGINNVEYYMAPRYYEFMEHNCIKFIDAKRGEVIFYQPGLIHGSLPNYSDKIRHALLITLQPDDEGLIYCYQQQHWINFLGYVDVYEADLDFWMMPVQPDPTKILKLIKRVRNNKPKVTVESLKKMTG